MAGVEQSVTSYCQYFLGDYDFFVRVGIRDDASSDEAEKVAKNVNFTFSKKLNKLFVKRRMKCPFGIGTTVSIPAGCRIKIHIFTTSSESNPVMRCMGHASTEHDNPDAPLHFFKSDNEDAVYRNCEKTGELSIHLPFRLYENNMDIETLQFLCCSSCVKGDTFIKFTLISAQEVVIGWHTFGLHVCSSPGRDRLLHENRSKRKIKKADTSKSKSQRTEGTQHTQSILETLASEEVHTLTTRSESVYEKLFKLNRGLELEEALTLEEQERILKR